MIAGVGGFPWLESFARKAAKETMTTPNTDSTTGALIGGAETAGSKPQGFGSPQRTADPNQGEEPEYSCFAGSPRRRPKGRRRTAPGLANVPGWF